MNSILLVSLLLLSYSMALSVQCTTPDMSVYTPQVEFVCTFDESVTLNLVERVFVPNFISLTPDEVEPTVFRILAGVTDNTLGEITLLLGEGAFKSGDVESPEYSVSVTYDFIHALEVVATVSNMSDRPDFAVISIGGGMTVRPSVNSVSEIADFPPCVKVLSVEATMTSYNVKVFVLDPAAMPTSLIDVKAGVISSYWGQKTNVFRRISISVLSSHTSENTLQLWPVYGTIYTTEDQFAYTLPTEMCAVDIQSFAGINVEIMAVEGEGENRQLVARLLNGQLPGSIKFLGFAPSACEAYNYPVETSVMIVKETAPTYELEYTQTIPGCVKVQVGFSTPVQVLDGDLFTVTAVAQSEYTVENAHTVKPAGPEHFFGLEATLCIVSDSETLLVAVNRDVVKTPSGAQLPEHDVTSIFISRASLVVDLQTDDLPVPNANLTYIIRQPEVLLYFVTDSSIELEKCDFSNAFTSDYNVAITVAMETGRVRVSAVTEAIDHHIITFNADRVTCQGAFNLEFLTTQFKYAYDPAFKPGDIIITRVNTYYSAEFDFVPLRKIYSWNKIFFTDAGWGSDLLGFIDHGTDGYISWTPKTDVEAGSVQEWSYKAMTDTLDPLIPLVVDTEYSFNYEQHGFLLDFQDNLFVYTTDYADASSQYDASNKRFLFGVYWSSSEWAPETNNYLDITAEYSALPYELHGYSVALGLSAYPVPRGVNYMSIKQDQFELSDLTYYTMLQKIIDKANWDVSQKDRFTMSPQVSYNERPMDFTVQYLDNSICFKFNVAAVSVYSSMMSLTFNGQYKSFSIDHSNTNGKCVSYDQEYDEGTLRLMVQPGAFKYETSLYTFESAAVTIEREVTYTPQLSIYISTSAPLQTVTISSSIPCDEWGFVVPTNSKAVYLSQTATQTTFALAVTAENARVYLEQGFCRTAGGSVSDSKMSSYVTAAPLAAEETMIRNAFFKNLVSNNHINSLVVCPPASNWSFNFDAFNGQSVQPTDQYSNYSGCATLDFTFSTESGLKTVSLPQGLFKRGTALSQAMTMSFNLHATPLNVMEKLTLPWAEPIRVEEVRNAVLADDLVVYSGSTPSDLLQFEEQCRAVGYVMGPTVATSVSVAIMDGDCVYGVYSGKVMDPYTNWNAGYRNSLEFDFLPPRAVAMVVEDETSGQPEVMRFYWNKSPVVALFFNEPLHEFDSSVNLVSVDNCGLAYLNHTFANDRSVVRYQLSDCLEGPVRVEVVANVTLTDDHENTVLSQDSIRGLPLDFETDYVMPDIVLSTETTILYSNVIDIVFNISEPMTHFTCTALGVAVEDASVAVEMIEETICRYTFTPTPKNGTHLLFFVPAGRFTDKALNPNTASNTLVPLALNLGAQITITGPEFTSELRSELNMSIQYSWLCPSYERLFPATLEYDRNLARIESLGQPTVVDGTVLQTFAITFLNVGVYPEERYKNFPVYVPAHVCSTPLGLANERVVFRMTFDNTHTEPVLQLVNHPETQQFTVEASFAGVGDFGAEEPASYMSVAFSGEEALECVVSRRQEGSLFVYSATCPVNRDGSVVVTILPGAVMELTGVASPEFLRAAYVDGAAPTVTLSPVDGATFGSGVNVLPMHVEVSEILTQVSDLWEMEGTNGLHVHVVIPSSSVSNQNVMVHMTRTDNSLRSGSFTLRLRAGALRDAYGNKNEVSNTVTFFYDFTRPVVTLNCPAEDVVLNRMTISGTVNKPFQTLTPANVNKPADCSVESVEQEGLSFSFTVSCMTSGTYSFSIKNLKDMVGNAILPGEVTPCTGTFTIAGPAISYTIRNLINEAYVNSATFAVELVAGPNCVSMNLTESNVITENVENLRLTQASACHWELTGSNIEEGKVIIRVLEKVAVDVFGGESLSVTMDFESYQSKPEVISVSPSLMEPSTTTTVTVCYDWNVIRGEGTVLAENAGCSEAEVINVKDNCVSMRVAVTSGQRCHLYLEEDFVHTAWSLGSAARYVMIEINDHPPVLLGEAVVGETVKPAVKDGNAYHLYVNGDMTFRLPVADQLQVDLDKIEVTLAGNPIRRTDKYIELNIAFAGTSNSVVMVTLNEGLLTDSFGRKSQHTVYMIHYSLQQATPTVTMSMYSAASPVTACVSYSHDVEITEENIETTMAVTVTSEPGCAHKLTFTPVAEGLQTFQLKNVMSVYGNIAQTSSHSFYLYTEQPVVTSELETVETSTRGPGYAGEIRMFFSHNMAADLPNRLDDIFTVNPSSIKLSEHFTMQSRYVHNNEVVITLMPIHTAMEYQEFMVTFADNAFVDMAGNTAVAPSFKLVIDNRAPAVETILHNGGDIFSKLPLTLTLTFTKPVMLSSNFASLITATSGDYTLTFVPKTRAAGLVTMVTVVSVENYELMAGMQWSVSIAPGIATDAYGATTQTEFASTMTVTDPVLILEDTQYAPRSTPGVTLTFDKGVKRVAEEKFLLNNAVLDKVTIDGKKVTITVTCAQQGAWTLRMMAGAIEGIDESLNAQYINLGDEFDGLSPMIQCDVPTYIGFGLQKIACLSSEALENTRSIMTVRLGEMVLNHVETLSADGLIMEVQFTAIEEYQPGFTGEVLLELDNCKDLAGNECLPIRYVRPIDFTPIAVDITTSREHVRSGDSVNVTVTLSRPVENDNVDLEIEYNDELMRVTSDKLTVVEEHRVFSWEVTVQSTEVNSEVVPLTFIVGNGTLADAFGSKNEEGSAVIYLNEQAPTIHHSYQTVGNTLVMTLNVLNGPLGSIDAEMMALSSNLQFGEVTSFESQGILTLITLTFQVSCTASCAFNVRFIASKIYDMAGNRLEHDFTVNGVFIRAPVVTMALEPYISSTSAALSVLVSERADIHCESIIIDGPAQIAARSCLNKNECVCSVLFNQDVELSKITFSILPGTIKNAYNLANPDGVQKSCFYNPNPTKPVFYTQWTQDQEVVNIPFTVSAGAPEVQLTQSMVQCTGCEITEWSEVEPVMEVRVYAFKVTFFNEEGNYARVFMEAGLFTDPFGKQNVASEYSIRRQAVAATVQQVSYSEQRKDVLVMQFSKPVHSCGGEVTLKCMDNNGYTYSFGSASSMVSIAGRKVTINLQPYGDLNYKIMWTENAFCDVDEYPVASHDECSACSFKSAPNVPAPPMITFTDTSESTATVHYRLTHNGGAVIAEVAAYVLPMDNAQTSAMPTIVRDTSDAGYIQLTGLTASATYKVTLQAKNMYGYSLPSEEKTLTTQAGPALSATALRICDMVNPAKEGNVYTYTEAVACWNASPSAGVTYRLTMVAGESEPVTMYEGTETQATVTVPQGVSSYQLTLVPVTSGIDGESVTAEFVTRVNLDDVIRFPQGAGIQVFAERLTKDSVRISFTHAQENYLRVEKYLVQYGNVFEEVSQIVGHARESYVFRADRCIGNQMTVTVRAGVRDGWWGVPSNRVTVYCKAPRLSILAEPGYDFVVFRVTSEVATTAVCTLQTPSSSDILAQTTLAVHPMDVAEQQLFKSLNPDTDYTIVCEGYDLEFMPVSGRTTFYTLANYVLPELTLGEVTETHVGSHAVHIPVASVTVPGTVYCAARPASQNFQLSRAQYMAEDHSAYVYPGLAGVVVTIDGLLPNTEYRARCLFDPDFAPALTATRRRLSDEEIEFTTPEVSVSTWEEMTPFGSVAVPASTTLTLTAVLPIRVYSGSMKLQAVNNPHNDVLIQKSHINVIGNKAVVTLPTLVPGEEYMLVMAVGCFVDAVSNFPLPGVTIANKISFTVFNDPMLSAAPVLVQTVPAAGEVDDLSSSDIYLTFDRSVRVESAAELRVNVNGKNTMVAVEKAEVNKNLVIVHSDVYFPEGAEVQVIVPAGDVCSLYGACAEEIVLAFTVGVKNFEPVLMSVTPVNGQSHVPASEDVVLRFNKAVVLEDDFHVVFVDEAGASVTLRYGVERSKTMPRLSVEQNVIRVRGDALPGGHTYTAVFDAEAIRDKQGRSAHGVPEQYTFTSSAYGCSGNYIFENMGDECECFATESKCECHCGKETLSDTIIGMYI